MDSMRPSVQRTGRGARGGGKRVGGGEALLEPAPDDRLASVPRLPPLGSAHTAFQPVGLFLEAPIAGLPENWLGPRRSRSLPYITPAGGRSRPRAGRPAPDDRPPVTQSDRRRPVCPRPFSLVRSSIAGNGPRTMASRSTHLARVSEHPGGSGGSLAVGRPSDAVGAATTPHRMPLDLLHACALTCVRARSAIRTPF